jgi:hypothetical protein
MLLYQPCVGVTYRPPTLAGWHLALEVDQNLTTNLRHLLSHLPVPYTVYVYRMGIYPVDPLLDVLLGSAVATLPTCLLDEPRLDGMQLRGYHVSCAT